MLSRTADNLYWLARYVERSDYLARILEATQRLATIPKTYGGSGHEWEGALLSAGVLDLFEEINPTLLPDESHVTAFLAYDARNPSCMIKCLEAARTNARGVRTAITAEMWDTINSAWLDITRSPVNENSHWEAVRRLFDLAKKLALDFDGSAHRTMLRNDAYWFTRLGHYMERVDNTARLLDVEAEALKPEHEIREDSLDYFRWTGVLRAVSALTSYHWVYRQSVKPWLVADLLILKPDMPRSLISCYQNIVFFLDKIADAYRRQGPAQRQARSMLLRLESSSMGDIFRKGLHEFVEGFLEENNVLGKIIAEQYLVG